MGTKNKIEWNKVDFANLRDIDIARQLNVSREAVRQMRKKLFGKPSNFHRKSSTFVSLAKRVDRPMTASEAAQEFGAKRQTVYSILKKLGKLNKNRGKKQYRITPEKIIYLKTISNLTWRELAYRLGYTEHNWRNVFWLKLSPEIRRSREWEDMVLDLIDFYQTSNKYKQSS